MFESRWDRQGIVGGLFSVVKDIQRNKSNPEKAWRAYEQALAEVLRLPASDTIPMFLMGVGSTEWTFVCISSLFLGAICQKNTSFVRRNVWEKVIGAITDAYEPDASIDNHMTSAAKIVALSMMGFEPAVQTLKGLAHQQGVSDWHEAGIGLHLAVIMAIATNPDSIFSPTEFIFGRCKNV